MNCKILINTDSGNCRKLNLNKLKSQLGCMCATVELFDKNKDWNADDCDTVVVCGGDGTLNHALNKADEKPIIYVPCGTLNESKRLGNRIATVGMANDTRFGYVCATGSFTEIGYSAKNESKRRLKAFAYIPQVLKYYKNHKIAARIQVDGREFRGEYTLIMAIKSKRCFGFDFNRCYDEKNGLYLLAVKSFGGGNALAAIKMFPTFFRIFFCGVSRPTVTDNWFLLPFENATIELENPQDFCFDGELKTMSGKICLAEKKLSTPITVMKMPK